MCHIFQQRCIREQPAWSAMTPLAPVMGQIKAKMPPKGRVIVKYSGEMFIPAIHDTILVIALHSLHKWTKCSF